MKGQFLYYLKNCTKCSEKSANHYCGGIKVVDQWMKKLFPSFKTCFDFKSYKDLLPYAKELLSNKNFKEYDSSSASNNMYSGSLDWYLLFLKAIELFSTPSQDSTGNGNNELQIIFYGAPGTGKSYKIDNDPRVTDDNTIRTTFHPDSDYSTFVGAYKPTMEEMPMSAFIGNEVHVAKPQGEHTGKEKKIVYKYVPQAFLKAYVAAWSDLDNPYFLVIEEINRGNCAQIFGDLFQLLDRNNMGCSSYAIHADEDISQFLSDDKNGFAQLSEDQKDAIRSFILVKDSCKTEAIGESILSGKKLLLPPNLYVWATMNTSDQSLFPIDSAFKRRWDWEYVPIEDAKKGYIIDIAGTQYDWWKFISTINEKIDRITGSEDKKLGYWFTKPAANKTSIDCQLFVSKVLFYLWNDVYKDYADSKDSIFRVSVNGQSVKTPFTSFFGDGREERVKAFMAANGIEPISITAPVTVTEPEDK